MTEAEKECYEKIQRGLAKQEKRKANRRKLFTYQNLKDGYTFDNLIVLPDNPLEVCEGFLRHIVGELYNQRHLPVLSSELAIVYLGVWHKDSLKFDADRDAPRVILKVHDVFAEIEEAEKSCPPPATPKENEK